MINLRNHLSLLNLNTTELTDNVFLIKDFFNDKDLEPIWSLVNSSQQQDWEGPYREQQKLLALTKFNRTDIDNLIAEGLMEYTDNWVDKNLIISEDNGSLINKKLQSLFEPFSDDIYVSNFEAVQRQYSGTELVEHLDSDGHPQVEFAAIGYLNDDYNGGEVFFSRLGIELVPPAKSLLIFGSGENYLHGVRMVHDGPVRYSLPTFLYHYIK